MKKLVTMCSFEKCNITLVTMLLFALSTSTAVEADMITSGAFFGPGAFFESFEGLSAGINITSAGNGYLQPGVDEAFTFETGVSLTWPIPNPGLGDKGVIIGDWSIGYAAYDFDLNGFVISATDVPFDNAYLALDALASAGSIKFTFMSDMLRVGAYVTGDPDIITLNAFDASDTLLESMQISSVSVSNWGSNFLGIQNTNGIRKIEFIGDFVALDGLAFEVVPVPGAVLLGIIGLSVAAVKLRKHA